MSEYLHIKDIHKDFSGLKVLTGVDFKVREKERHAVIGPNGAGKTTLFNIISGNFKASSGAILFKGRDVSGKPAHARNRLGLSRACQITNVFQELSVCDNSRSCVRSRHGLRYHFFRRPAHDRAINERTEAIAAEEEALSMPHALASWPSKTTPGVSVASGNVRIHAARATSAVVARASEAGPDRTSSQGLR